MFQWWVGENFNPASPPSSTTEATDIQMKWVATKLAGGPSCTALEKGVKSELMFPLIMKWYFKLLP